MKKIVFGAILILLLLLAACGSSKEFNVNFEKDIYYQKDKKSNFEIKVSSENKPVKGLDIQAEFIMANMDHGTYDVTLSEGEKGIYSGEAELPMAGQWEITFKIKQDGKAFEKVMEYEVKEPPGAATINGDWITNDDIKFYQFINELHIAINREQVKKDYQGKELKDALANLDNQESLIKDKNNLLTQIIRLRAMALLGSEKGFEASSKEITQEIDNIREQYGKYEAAKRMIKEFGEDKFWNKQEKQYKLIILSQKVQNDLISKVKKEHPDVNEQEILFLAQKQYEDLLVSQVNSLKIEIL